MNCHRSRKNLSNIKTSKEDMMARIKIKDLPKDLKISKEELRSVHGGWGLYSGYNFNLQEKTQELLYSNRLHVLQ